MKKEKIKSYKLLKIIRGIESAISAVICIAFGTLMAWLTSLWAIPAATYNRGYIAFGGEYLLISAVLWIGVYLMYRTLKAWRG